MKYRPSLAFPPPRRRASRQRLRQALVEANSSSRNFISATKREYHFPNAALTLIFMAAGFTEDDAQAQARAADAFDFDVGKKPHLL